MTASKKLIQAAAGSAGGGDFYPYTIDNSARFEGNNYLYRTYGGNTKTFTLSFWVKRAPGGGYTPGYFQVITGGIYYSPGGYYFLLWPNTSAGGRWLSQPDPSISSIFNDPSNTGRDFSAWYHYVFAFDSTQSTSTDRMKVWVNGVQQPWTGTYPPLNHNIEQFAGTMYIGRDSSTGQAVEKAGGGNSYGYLADMAITDGQYYSASDFGESKNGVWIPKDLSGLNFGTKGFWLDFKDSSNFGNDVSGNNLDFTAVGFQTHDQMIDTPTNNFCTLNAIDGAAIAEGNLQQSARSSSWATCQSTMAFPKTGKWYWEAVVSGSGSVDVGAIGISADPASSYVGSTTNSFSYLGANGYIYELGAATPYGATYGAGDIIGILWDADNGDLTFYKNGTSQGVAKSGLDTSIDYRPAVSQYNAYVTNVNFGQNGTFNGQKTAQGNSDANGLGDFYYTVPTGALALCTANLPEPAIGPNSATQSDENFNTVLYTGNGSTQSVTGVGFQPDFTWIKNRGGAYSHWLNDAVRGAGLSLASNTNEEEKSYGAYFTAFDSDGFSLAGGTAGFNATGNSYVGWNWKGNGSGVTNTDGTITSTVSANTNAGISIATFTMPSSGNFTVGHGLGVAPKMYIMKRTSNTSSWGVWHTGLSSGTYYILLDTTGAQVNDGTVWTSAPTSTVLNIGSAWPSGGQTAVIYSFAEVEGFSSFGSYTGNGSADGPFVYTGFRPAWIMIRQTNGTNWWSIQDTKRDPYNPRKEILYANDLAATSDWTAYPADILSNGFKIRYSGSGQNGSGSTYIYMAFAEMPFKYSVGR